MQMRLQHQYVCRPTGAVVSEQLISDSIINLIYNDRRENAYVIYRALVSKQISSLLAFWFFDCLYARFLNGTDRIIRALKVDTSEFYKPDEIKSARAVFERKIKYWDLRRMPENPAVIVSPADSRMLPGSLRDDSMLFLKEKFFDLHELFGLDKPHLAKMFEHGDYAIFRLTADRYHYNHCPVSGIVEDFYEVDGLNHSCNPGAVAVSVTPYSKNHRHVTVINTDVENGSRVGKVAMIEVAALMIGDICPAYSETFYDNPLPPGKGMFLRRGQPKSLYRPGSSVDVLLFESDRIEFDKDLVANAHRKDVKSRFSSAFGRQLVETDVNVRSAIAISKGL